MYDIYPLTICKTRYQGSYEGGPWAAFCMHPRDIPHQPFGDDLTAGGWWASYMSDRVGVGDTPEEAVADLWERMQRASR